MTNSGQERTPCLNAANYRSNGTLAPGRSRRAFDAAGKREMRSLQGATGVVVGNVIVPGDSLREQEGLMNSWKTIRRQKIRTQNRALHESQWPDARLLLSLHDSTAMAEVRTDKAGQSRSAFPRCILSGRRKLNRLNSERSSRNNDESRHAVQRGGRLPALQCVHVDQSPARMYSEHGTASASRQCSAAVGQSVSFVRR